MITKTDCYLKPNTSLKAILKEFREVYHQFVDVYYNSHVAGLPTGANIPPKNKIYSEAGKKEFTEYCYKYQELVGYLFSQQLEKVHRKMSEAPAPEVSAMISMLATRDNITEDEITHLLEEYGDNHQVYRALQNIGKKHNMTILNDEVMTREAGLRDLQHSVEKVLTVYGAETNSDGFYDFLSIPIDEVLTDAGQP